MAIKLLINAVDSEASGCQRLIYPVQSLAKNRGFEFEAVNTSDIRAQLRTTDIVLLQCLIGPQQHDLIKHIQSAGKPVIIDYDDDFSALPKNLVERIGQSRKSIEKNWAKYLKTADMITVPCDALARRVRTYTSKPIRVLPNLLRKTDLAPVDYDPFDDLSSFRILYSCSESHQRDFKYIMPVLKKIGEWYPNVKIISHGSLDFGYQCPKYRGKHRHYAKTSYNSYYKYIQEFKPHVFIAPLTFTPHNAARSDLKYLQAGALKCAFVGSNMEPYAHLKGQMPLPEFRLGWFWTLRKLIKNPELAREYGIAAFHDVKDNYILDEHIDKWEAAYCELL